MKTPWATRLRTTSHQARWRRRTRKPFQSQIKTQWPSPLRPKTSVNTFWTRPQTQTMKKLTIMRAMDLHILISNVTKSQSTCPRRRRGLIRENHLTTWGKLNIRWNPSQRVRSSRPSSSRFLTSQPGGNQQTQREIFKPSRRHVIRIIPVRRNPQSLLARSTWQHSRHQR